MRTGSCPAASIRGRAYPRKVFARGWLRAGAASAPDFPELLDVHQEPDGLLAVDNAVVIRQRQVHHGAKQSVPGSWGLRPLGS